FRTCETRAKTLLHLRDRELREIDSDVDTGPGSRQRDRHVALRQDLRGSRLDDARVRLARGVRSEDVVDRLHTRDLPLAVEDLALAERQTAAGDLDRHLRRLAVAAGDRPLP